MTTNNVYSRRAFGALLLGTTAACASSPDLEVPAPVVFTEGYGPHFDSGYNLPGIPPEYTQGINRRMSGTYLGEAPRNSIDVDPYAKFLYHVLDDGTAVRYPVGVGRAGKSFAGDGIIQLKKKWPGWTATANMLRTEPDVYGPFARGIPGGLRSPLGAAALAGTSFPIDRHATAEALGFDRPTANSLDSVSDRDFALEFLAASSICAMHLSRFAEELVIWSSAQFRFVAMSDRWSTGSSIMPQKRNPDAAELIRAKIGRIFGANVALMTVMKGLPLTYSKDMQEDKEQVFDAADSLMLALAAMTGMVSDMTANRPNLKAAASSGFSTATDLADWLVRELNLPFRDAHHVTGSLVAVAEGKGCDLQDLTLEDMQAVHAGIRADVFDVLGVENSVASRMSYGGTAPVRVREQIARWKEALK